MRSREVLATLRHPWMLSALGLVLLLGLAACGHYSSPVGEDRSTAIHAVGAENHATASQTGTGPEEIDFSNPFLEGRRFPSVSRAADKVAFGPVTPSGVGGMAYVLVNDPAMFARPDRALGLVYDESSPYGRFVVGEVTADPAVTPATWAAMAAQCDPDNGCEGEWRVVALDDGTPALLVSGPASTDLRWLQGKLMMDVFGPPDTFSANDALAVANAMN